MRRIGGRDLSDPGLSLEGQEAASAALGIQHDMLRGLSANFGLNHKDGSVVLGSAGFLEAGDARAEFSIKRCFWISASAMACFPAK